MDDRKAERIGHVLLRDRDRHAAAVKEVQCLGALIEKGDEIGGALQRRPAADAQEVLIEDSLFARGDPGQVVGEIGIARV
ncbi:hypothetical protein D3C87_1668630 [compost metagenome]